MDAVRTLRRHLDVRVHLSVTLLLRAARVVMDILVQLRALVAYVQSIATWRYFLSSVDLCRGAGGACQLWSHIVISVSAMNCVFTMPFGAAA